MIAMAGKYIVYIEKQRLILEHPAGISFDLTQEDAKELAVLVSNWQLATGTELYGCQLEAEQRREDVEIETIESDETVSKSDK
jgi:hypothetical protein